MDRNDEETGLREEASGAQVRVDARSAEATMPAPDSLDAERDDVDRNAAGGGWEGANEVIENDFETEQLRRDAGSADTEEMRQ
jgi:hypothetical protein